MEVRIVSENTIERFYQHLLNEEKSANTVEKYIRDTKAFMLFADGTEITKELVIGYKQKLIEGSYAVRSINSILASINSLFVFLGMDIKQNRLFKWQFGAKLFIHNAERQCVFDGKGKAGQR